MYSAVNLIEEVNVKLKFKNNMINVISKTWLYNNLIHILFLSIFQI
jgi:hypothetical protein